MSGMTSVVKAKSGPRFTRDHQLALLLIRHLGPDGAVRACYSNQWHSVLRAVEEQRKQDKPQRLV